MRRLSAPSIAVSILGFAAGLAYRYSRTIRAKVARPTTCAVAFMARGSRQAAGAVHPYLVSRGSEWLKRSPLLVEMAVRAVVMALVISTVGVGL
jgi:hypothetical protein